MLPELIKIIHSRISRIKLRKAKPLEPNDHAITMLAHSPIASELYAQASSDGVSFKRASLKGMQAYYDEYGEKCVLNLTASFDSTAHETVHHKHRASNDHKDQLLHNDKILKLLIHEAEAYALQALVVLEAHQSAADKNQEEELKIATAIKTISRIYPNFEQELSKEQSDQSKRQIAHRVFTAYLTAENHAFKGHLKNYNKQAQPLPQTAIILGNSALIIGLASLIAAKTGFDIGLKTYAAIIATYTAISIISKYTDGAQSTFQKVFSSCSIGNIPTIDGNYLDDIANLPKTNKKFDITLETISDYFDSQYYGHEKNALDILTFRHPKIQMAAHKVRELLPAMPQ